jgi:hypothetical protein
MTASALSPPVATLGGDGAALFRRAATCANNSTLQKCDIAHLGVEPLLGCVGSAVFKRHQTYLGKRPALS